MLKNTFSPMYDKLNFAGITQNGISGERKLLISREAYQSTEEK